MRHDINAMPDSVWLGRVGQNNAVKVKFDVTDWIADYPAGVLSIRAIRPTETTVYTPASFATAMIGAYAAGTTYTIDQECTSGGYTYCALQTALAKTPATETDYWELVGTGTLITYVWTVDDIDSGIMGLGGAEIYITEGTTIDNSVAFSTQTDYGIPDSGGVLTATPTLTTRGDILTRDASTYKRLALGANGYILASNGTDILWIAPTVYETAGTNTTHNASASAHSLNSAAIVGALPMPDAGSYFTTDTITGQMQQLGLYGNKALLTTTGDIVYRSTTEPVRLARGTNGQVLRTGSSNIPEWFTMDSSPATILTTEGDIMFRNATVPARLAKGTAGQVLKMNSGATAPEWVTTSLTGYDTWNPGSLADGVGETSAAFTVTGAAFGDTVLVGAPYDLQGITCTAYVSAANYVKIRLQNETGGTIDLASGSWKVRVIKQ